MYFGSLTISEILEILDYVFSKESIGDGVYELYKTAYWIMRNKKYSAYPVSNRSMIDIDYISGTGRFYIERNADVRETIGFLTVRYFIRWYEECKELLDLGEEYIYIEAVFNILLVGNPDFLHRHNYLSKTVLGENHFELMKSEILLKTCLDVSLMHESETSPIAIITHNNDKSKYIIKVFGTIYKVTVYDKSIIISASVELNKETSLVSIKTNKMGQDNNFILFSKDKLVYAPDSMNCTETNINLKRYLLLGRCTANYYRYFYGGGISYV